MTRLTLGTVVVGLALTACSTGPQSEPTRHDPQPTTTEEDWEGVEMSPVYPIVEKEQWTPEPAPVITPELVVNELDRSGRYVNKMCASVSYLGYGVALAGFRSGYGPPRGGITATELFDEIVSRC